MELNITAEFMPLLNLIELFNKSTNIKDVYLLSDKAACPVYIVRDNDDKCLILFHPLKDGTDDLKVEIQNSKFTLNYDSLLVEFESLQNLKQDMILSDMIGDNPYDINNIIWSR